MPKKGLFHSSLCAVCSLLWLVACRSKEGYVFPVLCSIALNVYFGTSGSTQEHSSPRVRKTSVFDFTWFVWTLMKETFLDQN